MDTFKNRLQEAMRIRNVKASDLSKRTGLSKAQISQYVNGVYEAKQKALYKLAVSLNVSETWLMGYDVDMKRNQIVDDNNGISIDELIQLHYGIDTLQLVTAFDALNEKGKEKVLTFTDDIKEMKKYRKEIT